MLSEAGGAVLAKDWKKYKETKQGFDAKSPT